MHKSARIGFLPDRSIGRDQHPKTRHLEPLPLLNSSISLLHRSESNMVTDSSINTAFSFLHFPLEVRLAILRHIVVSSVLYREFEYRLVAGSNWSRMTRKGRRTIASRFIFVGKFSYQEGINLLCGSNKF